MKMIRALGLGIDVTVIAAFLAAGCGGGSGSGLKGKDAGQSEGGVSGAGGSLALGGAAGGSSTGGGGGVGTGGSTGAGGLIGTDGGVVDANTSPVPACTSFNACGGSIVGTWKLPGKVLCGSKGTATPPPSGCMTINNLADLEQTGTLMFSADGTWVSNITFRGTETLSYPVSCLSGGTCAGQSATLPDAGMVGSCVENGAGLCVCTYTLDMSASGHGTYTTSAGKLSVVGSTPSAMDYCVQGNTLSMNAVDSNTGDQATQIYDRQ